MAIDFIHVDTTTTTATKARELLDLQRKLKDAYQQAQYVLALMGHMNNGSDFSLIETRFGLEAGKGQTVFDLVNGTKGSMEGTFQVADAKTLAERVG